MDKMAQYLLLAKSARGRALAEIIMKATAEPSVFAFGELWDLPNVQEVSYITVVCLPLCSVADF
jgi:COP9 signalosome complex subunit 7